MNANSPLTEALLAAATVAIFLCGLFLLLYRIVAWARRQKKRAYIVGAALAPFIALGNVSDPDFRIVQEAKRLKNREDDNPGDPPDPDDEQLVLAAARAAAKEEEVVRKKEVITIVPKPARPALVWILSIVLGFAAVLASLVLSWLLLSDPSSLSREARLGLCPRQRPEASRQ